MLNWSKDTNVSHHDGESMIIILSESFFKMNYLHLADAVDYYHLFRC